MKKATTKKPTTKKPTSPTAKTTAQSFLTNEEIRTAAFMSRYSNSFHSSYLTDAQLHMARSYFKKLMAEEPALVSAGNRLWMMCYVIEVARAQAVVTSWKIRQARWAIQRKERAEAKP